MQRKFVINGKEYTATPFDFNILCDLEELGVSLTDLRKNVMSGVRAYFAICADMDREEAGNELGAHLMNGGSVDELVDAMREELTNSDFFRALTKSEEEEAPTRTRKKRTEKE